MKRRLKRLEASARSGVRSFERRKLRRWRISSIAYRGDTSIEVSVYRLEMLLLNK